MRVPHKRTHNSTLGRTSAASKMGKHLLTPLSLFPSGGLALTATDPLCLLKAIARITGLSSPLALLASASGQSQPPKTMFKGEVVQPSSTSESATCAEPEQRVQPVTVSARGPQPCLSSVSHFLLLRAMVFDIYLFWYTTWLYTRVLSQNCRVTRSNPAYQRFLQLLQVC